MKNFAYIFGLVLIATALVAIGLWFGFRGRYLTEAYAITTVDKHLTDAGTKATILHQLDSGHIDEARQFLRMQLDGDILMVDSLLDSSDARSRDLASKVFARISSFRAEYPSNYTAQIPEVDAKIAEILSRDAQLQSK